MTEDAQPLLESREHMRKSNRFYDEEEGMVTQGGPHLLDKEFTDEEEADAGGVD